MDIETLIAALAQPHATSLGIALLAGFFFSFNPVALAVIPVSLAYVTKARDARNALIFGGTFVVGMIVIHVLLGLVAGFGGRWVERMLGREWGLVLGPLLIALGMAWAGWLRLPIPQVPLRARPAATLWGAALLGAAFSVAICPFCTPALVALLGVAAGTGSPLLGGALLFAFALGRTIPVIAGTSAVGWLEARRTFRRSRRAFEMGAGVLLILSGLYMLNAYFLVLPGLAA